MDFEIVEWNTHSYPQIQEANEGQQECFTKIQQEILQGNYVDVGKNDAYLFSYNYYLFDILLEIKKYNTSEHINGKTVFIPSAFVSPNEYRLDITSMFRNFIEIYKHDKPNVVKYAYPGLIFADIYISVPKEMLIQDFILFRDFCYENSFHEYGRFLVLLYRHIYDIKPETSLNDYQYIPLYAQFSFKSYLTAIGINAYDVILENIKELAKADYNKCKINFLYRMYDFVDGSLCGSANGHYIDYLSSDYLNSKWSNNSDYTQREIHNGSTLFLDNFLVPDKNKKKLTIYLESLLREAENKYRLSVGLPKVGEGWISETLLFKQIVAAFPYEVVEQHATPYFLGKQHYDVYIPKYKIAIEYQGEQHIRPIDFFGGDISFIKNQERDSRKKQLSRYNGVKLIEVFPNYKIQDVIYEILTYIEDINTPSFNTQLKNAVELAGKINTSSTIEQDFYVEKLITKKTNKANDMDKLNSALDKIIAELVLKRSQSDYAKKDLSNEEFEVGFKKYKYAESIKKQNSEEALDICMNLIKNGIYNAPVVYGCAAQILRKQKHTDEEIELLLQMKRDYGYTNYDNRLKTLLKSNYADVISDKLNS